jgi:hypothetical protein
VPKAIALIVASYAKTRNRRPLADLRIHRRKVLGELEAISGIDPANAVQAVLDEVATIEAGP